MSWWSFWPLWACCWGSLGKNQAETDRIAQRVLTEVVTDLETSYQRVTQEGRSLVENPAKLEGVYRYFTLSPSEYETWRLNAQFLLISNCPYIRILTASIWAIKTSRVSMSPCRIIRQYLSLPGNHRGGKPSLSGPLQRLTATAIRFLTDPTTGAGVGITYMKLNQKILTAAIDNARGVFRSLCGSSPWERDVPWRDRDNQKMLNGKPVARSMATSWM